MYLGSKVGLGGSTFGFAKVESGVRVGLGLVSGWFRVGFRWVQG